MLPALARPETDPAAQPGSLLSKTLEHTHFVAPKKAWKLVSDALDDDGDPEFQLQRRGIEVSINETSTVPFITIDAAEAIESYFSMMQSLLKAQKRPWPEQISKPEQSACIAFVATLYAAKDKSLPLKLTCYVPYRGGTAIIQAEIATHAKSADQALLSRFLHSVQPK